MIDAGFTAFKNHADVADVASPESLTNPFEEIPDSKADRIPGPQCQSAVRKYI